MTLRQLLEGKTFPVKVYGNVGDVYQVLYMTDKNALLRCCETFQEKLVLTCRTDFILYQEPKAKVKLAPYATQEPSGKWYLNHFFWKDDKDFIEAVGIAGRKFKRLEQLEIEVDAE